MVRTFAPPLGETKIYKTFAPDFQEQKQKFSRTLDKEFYVKLFTYLHFSRRTLNQIKRKSSIIFEKNSGKKVRGVMKKRTFIFVLFSKIR
jgi:hypothetical protein